MALSDREQKLLDELERGLYDHDANFANKIGNPSAPTPAKLILGLAIILIGVSLIVFAVIIQVALFGVVAFLVMLAGLITASSNLKTDTKTTHHNASKTSSSMPKRSFFEDRWSKRQGE